MRSYSLRQSENERSLRERREKAYASIPALAQLDSETGALAVESAKARFMQDYQKADALKSRIRLISAKRVSLLKEHGFPENYLETWYHCPDCSDTGYIGRDRCHCFWQQAAELFYTQSDLRRILQKENFETFRLDYYPDKEKNPVTGMTARENMRRILGCVRTFTDSFTHKKEESPAQAPNLFLYGGTGLGKTFLSHCIAKELLDQAFSVIYYSSFELFEAMASDVFGRQQSDKERDPVSEYLYSCDLLIIDDLGTEMTNTFVASSLFQLLNERILHSKSTLISTNLSLSAFADTYTERVFSRITSSFTFLGLYGDDIRLKKALASHAQI